jgi:hypothetical protein
MKELLYDQNSFLITGVLLAFTLLATEAGYRMGRRARAAERAEVYRDHVNAVQASLLGVLALLLGFTLSLALQRFDSRSEAVVEEANSIGTTWLRAQLLPASIRRDVSKRIQQYVDLRVRDGVVSLDREAERAELLAQTSALQAELWDHARRAVEEDPGMTTSGLFIQSLNETIDSLGTREAALRRHVPELVLLLFGGALLIAGSMMGHAAGIAGHRPSLATYSLIFLIFILAFTIIDLDRPRRGLITIDQSSMVELKAMIDSAASEPLQPSNGRR